MIEGTGWDGGCTDVAACIEAPRSSQEIVVPAATERVRDVGLRWRWFFIILCDDGFGWDRQDVFVLGNLKKGVGAGAMCARNSGARTAET